MKKDWEQAPDEIPHLDVRWLFHETDDRTSTPENAVSSTTVLVDEVNSDLFALLFFFTDNGLINECNRIPGEVLLEHRL